MTDLVFRQLFDAASSTYTYLLAHEGEAVLIDTVFEQHRRDAALLAELDLKLVAVLDTHLHADHVTGAYLFKMDSDAPICVAEAAGTKNADRTLVPGDKVTFGKRHLEVRATPGHTSGCVTYVLDDKSMAFTGDALLIRGAGRTDFQQGNAEELYDSVHQQIFSLPDTCRLWPAHDYRGRTMTTVAEEKQFNPRLGGNSSKSDFVGYMNALGLGHPKQIDEALPANKLCGKPTANRPFENPDWAPLEFSYAGIWEIAADWLADNLDKVHVLDVRSQEEYQGTLGHIAGAQLIPIAELEKRASEIPKDKPIVTVCRSGSRSAQATVLLGKRGFEDVANLRGGMLRWSTLGLPSEGAAR